ncbi:FAD-dependent monooxygenase [Streptomyces sp. NPDC006872]|uniref:FAD-dependent oxidoreductase n=1 Tax=Streptomyces sp. NPDC006872 TaxID=3155720 RepID=UPI003407D15A
MRVVIVGGGIGGLALAHGLLRQDIEVEVHERDAFAGARWEGYRLDIEEMGMRALSYCLPSRSWDQFLKISHTDDGMTWTTEQLNPLLHVGSQVMFAPMGHLGADRPSVRRLLQFGLDHVLSFGREFVHYETEPDGQVTAVFADGHRATGDVLVGADGAGSRVGAQYLPGGEPESTGVVTTVFKVVLDEDSRQWIPPLLTRGMCIVTSDTPAFGFTAAFDPPALDPDLDITPYVLIAPAWPVTGPRDDPAGLSGKDLIKMVGGVIETWHPALRRMVSDSEPDSNSAVLLRASPARPPWNPSPVVLLGDALHTMPPTAGRGANTALRDAHLLARRLGDAANGRRNLLSAVGEYEAEVRDYGAGIVEGSVRRMAGFTSSGRIRVGLNRAFLRTCAALPPLRDKLFAGPSGHGAVREWERLADLEPLSGKGTS